MLIFAAQRMIRVTRSRMRLLPNSTRPEQQFSGKIPSDLSDTPIQQPPLSSTHREMFMPQERRNTDSCLRSRLSRLLRTRFNLVRLRDGARSSQSSIPTAKCFIRHISVVTEQTESPWTRLVTCTSPAGPHRRIFQ